MGTRTFISPSNVPIYDDGAGNQAVIHTEWVQLPSGLLVAQRADNGGIPLSTSRITTEITDAVLAASGSYIQGWQDAQALAVNFVSGSVYADEAGTLYVDFSEDGTNVYGTSTTTLAFTPTTVGTANGATLPYPVEIPTRYFRFRYVNGATVQGVFQLYQTPVSAWSPRQVGLTGSLVPLNALPYSLIATIPYSDLVTNGNYYPSITELHPNARARLFGVYSSVNETVDAQFGIIDSKMLIAARTEGASGVSPDILYPTSATSISGGNLMFYSSEYCLGLGEPGDSLFGVLSLGATAPTSGNIYIWLKEVL